MALVPKKTCKTALNNQISFSSHRPLPPLPHPAGHQVPLVLRARPGGGDGQEGAALVADDGLGFVGSGKGLEERKGCGGELKRKVARGEIKLWVRKRALDLDYNFFLFQENL